MTSLRAVKGMNDVLPEEMPRWHFVERTYAETMRRHGYREVRTPYVEPTGLFVRTVGETTDIVEKEMYSFVYQGEELTLRPEGTAGAARAYVEHSVHGREGISRWYYVGPMFRGERPQRGRYRQFYQLGAEIFGDAGPGCDAEMIDMLVGFLRELGIGDAEVLVNSIGGSDTRERFKQALVQYLEPRKAKLTADSQRRLGTNPLRILDSKAEEDQAAIAEAPTVLEFLAPEDRAHFDKLEAFLKALGTPYRVEPRLVRGLDYYTRTLFEIKGAKAKLGAGDTLLGGGRYDNMVGDLGGGSVPALGFAAGLERLLIASEASPPPSAPPVYVAALGDAACSAALVLARDLRKSGLSAEGDARGGSLKSQLRRANTLGARFALVVGESELARGVVQAKDLGAHAQEEVSRDRVHEWITARMTSPEGSAS
jgi:histidyl-tRNA synthetase